MRPSSSPLFLLGSLLATATTKGVFGFKNTHPLLAWTSGVGGVGKWDGESSSILSLLSSLSPSFPSSFLTSSSSSSEEQEDLCTLSSILLISHPTLHASDLHSIPYLAQETDLLFSKQEANTNHLYRPYIPVSHSSEKRPINPDSIGSGQLTYHPNSQVQTLLTKGDLDKNGRDNSGSLKMVKKFVNECGAVVKIEKNGDDSLKKEMEYNQDGRVVRIVMMGKDEHVGEIDSLLRSLTPSNPFHLTILTTLPRSSLSLLSPPTPPHSKRSFTNGHPSPRAPPAGSTSIPSRTYPDPAPLLQVYRFFSPNLILCIGIVGLIFLPALIWTVGILDSTETVKGLERGRMEGRVEGKGDEK